ncbi:energy transducer TonB [Microbulbifer sp. HZ11]|uniref:energy transducer TonB n=1 Tax=unclassified Microbulbifer TaxID=2619833 RepID=UPI0005B83170|nr:energy transducer TonB [Microbulbifer sp. HZ11]
MKALHFALALPLLAASLSVDAAPRLIGAKQQGDVESYSDALNRHTMKNLRYPSRAQQRGWEGEVVLKIVVNKSGEVQDIQVVEESSYSSLNREALRSVERANPYPQIPSHLGVDSFSFTVPIRFSLGS